MPVIKAADLAYGRLRSPDLDKQEEFLTAFGMVRADRTKNALYMRGTDGRTTSTSPNWASRNMSASPFTPAAWKIWKSCRASRAPRRSRTSTSPAAASACA
jgi:hypothetical protein